MYKNRKRIPGLNVIRTISALGILQIHFLELCRQNGYRFALLETFNSYGNLSWGLVGTEMFFILSGVSLIYNEYDRDEPSWASMFYFRRFTRLLPLVYTLHLIFYFIYAVIDKGWPYHWNFRMVLNMMIGRTYVGEWFTTVILVCYLLFPLFRYLIRRSVNCILTTIILAIIFVGDMKLHFLVLDGIKYFSFANGIFGFWTGMLIGKFLLLHPGILSRRKNRAAVCTLILSGLLTGLMPGISLLFNPEGPFYYLPAYLCSVSLFMFLLLINHSNRFFDSVSDYSFEVYLLHHQIMYLLFPVFMPLITTQNQMILFFILMIFIILSSSYSIRSIEKYISGRLSGSL